MARQVHHKPAAIRHSRSVDAVSVNVEALAQLVDDLSHKVHILASSAGRVGRAFPCVIDATRVNDDRLVGRASIREARVAAVILRGIVTPTEPKQHGRRPMRVVVRGHAHDCTAGAAVWTPELNVFWLPRFRPIYCGRQLLRRRRLQCWHWRRFRRWCRSRSGGRFRCRFRRRGRCGSWCRVGRGSRGLLGSGNASAADQHRSEHRQRHRYGNSHEQNEARSAPSFNTFNRSRRSHGSHMSHKRNTRGNPYFTGAATRRPL